MCLVPVQVSDLLCSRWLWILPDRWRQTGRISDLTKHTKKRTLYLNNFFSGGEIWGLQTLCVCHGGGVGLQLPHECWNTTHYRVRVVFWKNWAYHENRSKEWKWIFLPHLGTASVAHQLAVSWPWSLNVSRVSSVSSFRLKEPLSQVPQLTLVGEYQALHLYPSCCRLVWQALSLPSWRGQRAGKLWHKFWIFLLFRKNTVMFSKKAVICQRNGSLYLQFR